MRAAANGVRAWEDPSVFAVNKRAAHTPLHSFQNVAQAFEHVAAIGRAVHSEAPVSKLVLNGTWQFRLFDSPEDVPEDFHTADTKDVEDWHQVHVAPLSPGYWPSALSGGVVCARRRSVCRCHIAITVSARIRCRKSCAWWSNCIAKLSLVPCRL